MTKESSLYNLFRLEAAKYGATVFRNNRGMFLTLDAKRKIRAGLEANGSSDLIGLTKNGQFLAIEVKIDGQKPSPEQQAFLNFVNQSGGLGFVACSVEDIKKHLCD